MIVAESLPRRSRLAALLDHFATVEDPRDVRRISHRLDEILLLVVCGTIADCDDYEDIAGWGAAHLDFLRRHLPYENGVPGERWLTILMNRINPALFADAFAAWVRESWPDKATLVAIDGKTSRRSHDRARGAAPCTSSPPSPPPPGWCWRPRPSPTRRASSPPSRRCSSASARTMA